MGQAVVLSCKLSSEQMIMRRRGMEREEEEEEASANEGEEVAVEQQQQQQPRRRVQAILKAKQGQQHSSKAQAMPAGSSTSTRLPPPTSMTGMPSKRMCASVQLVDDELRLLDTVKDFLCETNRRFTVIGAVGPQGTGKSTILSMLAGNDPLDMYRQYIFRPSAREAVESCRYQSTKVSIYISHKSRTVFLDCQPLNCAPLLEDCSHSYRSKAGPLESLELETLQLLLLLANCCHSILLCLDWFPDLGAIRRLQRVELFPNFLPPNGGVNLVLLHQRARPTDFQPLLVAERMRLLEGIFAGTFFKIDTGLTMASLGISAYEHIESSTNYLVFRELRPRTRADAFAHQELNQKCQQAGTGTDYGQMVSLLRTKMLKLPKSMPEMAETEWFSRLTECWAKISQDLPRLTEDGSSLLTRQRATGQATTTPDLETSTADRSTKREPAVPGKRNVPAFGGGTSAEGARPSRREWTRGGGGGRGRRQQRNAAAEKR